MAKSEIVERIEREIGIPGLAELLAERLTPTDLQSLLLDVYHQRAHRQQPSAVLSEYLANRFVRPSTISPVRLAEWERTAFANLPPEFQSLALSPVCPLGTCSAVAQVDQNRVLSTTRNTEVVSNSTNVLALECAVQRRLHLRANPKSTEQVHLAASHRLMRTQLYSSNPRLVPHFSLFALCSAGRKQGNLGFEISTLVTHIGFYLRSLRAFLGKEVGLRLALTDFGANDRRALLSDQIFAPVQSAFAGVDCLFDDERTGGKGYYEDLCFHIYAATRSGEMLELADGGAVNWTQILLSSAKERCVISAIGSERVCTAFGE